MKQRHNAGFSLIEVLVAIVLLGAVVVPTCTSLVLATDMNGRTEQLMKAQLAVSSAVETLMAEGISGASQEYDIQIVTVEENGETVEMKTDRFPDVTVVTEEKTMLLGDGLPVTYYSVTVTSEEVETVSLTTSIRKGGSGS